MALSFWPNVRRTNCVYDGHRYQREPEKNPSYGPVVLCVPVRSSTRDRTPSSTHVQYQEQIVDERISEGFPYGFRYQSLVLCDHGCRVKPVGNDDKHGVVGLRTADIRRRDNKPKPHAYHNRRSEYRLEQVFGVNAHDQESEIHGLEQERPHGIVYHDESAFGPHVKQKYRQKQDKPKVMFHSELSFTAFILYNVIYVQRASSTNARREVNAPFINFSINGGSSDSTNIWNFSGGTRGVSPL